MLVKLRKQIMGFKDVQAAFVQEFQIMKDTTTFRTVPHISKSKSICSRIFWLLIVLAFFCMLLWQLSMTFSYYLAWPVESVYREDDGRPVFPDITICNKDYLAYENNNDLNLNWSEYLKLTSRRKEMLRHLINDASNNLTSKTYEDIWSFIQTPLIYLSNFPATRSKSETSTNNLIRHHHYTTWNFEINDTDPVLKFHWNSRYSTCYTIHTKSEYNRSFRGISLTLYLDNFPTVMDTGSFKDLDEKTGSGVGVKVVVHAPRTIPFFASGLNVGPGTHTILHLLNRIRKRQPIPHGNCKDEKSLKETNPSSLNPEDAYSKQSCYEICTQPQIIDKCGCLHPTRLFTKSQLDKVNGKICGNQSFTRDDHENAERLSDKNGFNQLNCVWRHELDMDSCAQNCSTPCEEYQYDVTISSSPWPKLTSHLLFYKTYINQENTEQTNVYEDKFDIYGEILTSSMNSSEKLRKLRKIHLIEDNFIKLEILFDRSHAMTLEEIPHMPWYELLSVIGGCLSLWLDITLVQFVEIIEFLCAVFFAVRAKPAKGTVVLKTADGSPKE